MNQFLGIEVKGLFVVLLFVPIFAVPSICSAVNACVSGTPILNVIAPNPKAPGGNVSYSVKAVGYGFATYELWASDKGLVNSGKFISGQTVSGDYDTPTGSGLITFNIKDAGGNVIPNCYAEANITASQDRCGVIFRNYKPTVLYLMVQDRNANWGYPTSYFSCARTASALSHGYWVNFANTGLVNSGNVRDDQMVIGFYRIPYGTNRETFSFAYGDMRGLLSWATSAPPCSATFSLSGALAVGSNIRFDANANIGGNRPDNYNWIVDRSPYAQGNDKNVVYGSFSAGPHTVLLRVDDGLGTSCSRSQSITIPVPPPLPPPLPCTVDFDVRNSTKSCLTSSCNYNEPITFVATSSSLITGYTWTMDKTSGGNEAFAGGNTGSSVSKTFVPADGKGHKIHLVARDSNGNTCTMDKTINIKPSMPGWNEITPYLMQLGSIGFLVMVFLARIIFLRL